MPNTSSAIESFTVLYNVAIRRHRALYRLSAKVLKDLDQRVPSRLMRNRVDTSEYITIVSCALLLLATSPVLIDVLYRMSVKWIDPLYSTFYLRDLFEGHLGIRLAGLLVASAAPFYTIFVPISRGAWQRLFGRIALRKIPAKAFKEFRLKMGSVQYVLFAILVNYLALLVDFVLIRSYTSMSRSFFAAAATIWLMVPAVAISTLPALLCMIALVLAQKDSLKGRTVSILLALLRLINKLDQSKEQLNYSEQTRVLLARKILRIGYLIGHLYDNKSGAVFQKIFAAKLQSISGTVMSSVDLLLFPKGDGFKQLKARLIHQFNSIASGNFQKLTPKEGPHRSDNRVRENREKSVGIIVAGTLLLYLVLPLLMTLLITHFTKTEIPQALQPLLGTLYVTWVVVGAIIFIGRLTPDARNLLRDIISGLLGRS